MPDTKPKRRLNLALLKDPWVVVYAGSLEETYPALLWSRPPSGIGVHWWDTASDAWEWWPHA